MNLQLGLGQAQSHPGVGQHAGGRRSGGPARQRRRERREEERQDRAKAEQAATTAASTDDLQVNPHEANEEEDTEKVHLNGNQILDGTESSDAEPVSDIFRV